MGNNKSVVSLLCSCALFTGAMAIASPQSEPEGDALPGTAVLVDAYRRAHPGVEGAVRAMAHKPKVDKSRHVPPGKARVVSDKPLISLPAGKKN